MLAMDIEDVWELSCCLTSIYYIKLPNMVAS